MKKVQDKKNPAEKYQQDFFVECFY